ncbi:PIN domain-containing protein [Haloarchaeobius sp. TZWWS8]|uniref:PIN domain-containing protein n=1 Tax=Haloarchaeobius sp. TZWWS8 TaxID=3446121 RepID=UPI003EB7AD97
MSESATRVVADADVLAADLLVGGASRDALDHVRSHSWLTLVASEQLLDDAEAVIATLADAELAADWRARVEDWCELVDHPTGDHPALASAYQGSAAHVLSFDEGLGSVEAGTSLNAKLSVSVRPPDAFARLFDAESLYEGVIGGDYPGPDRDPQA